MLCLFRLCYYEFFNFLNDNRYSRRVIITIILFILIFGQIVQILMSVKLLNKKEKEQTTQR